MSSTRTQVYLTEEQRRKVDQLADAEGVAMAEIVRRALDMYLSDDADATTALAATFGAAPSATAPSRDEWQRGRRHQLVAGFVTEQHRLGHLEPAATSHAGLRIAARIINGRTERQIASSVDAEGIRLGSYHDCWHTPPDHDGIVIGFGNITTSDLPVALAIVAGAFTS